MSTGDFPQGILMQPNYQPVPCTSIPWDQHEPQKPDSESLVQEEESQLKFQQWVQENEVQYSIDLKSDTLEDSLEINLDKQEETAYDTNQYTTGLQKSAGDGRRQEPEDKYFELRYYPDWKSTKKEAQFLEARKASQVAEGSNLEVVQDSFYLHSHGPPEEKQEEAKPRDELSGLDTQLPGFHEPRAVVSRERLNIKGREQAGDCHSKDNPSTHGINLSNSPQRAKQDFVKKNKRTLGLHSKRKKSYLQLHDKKQVLQKQVADPKTVDEEPVQCLPPLQVVKKKPEDTQYLKAQQLKEQQNKLSQKNETKSNPNLKGRAFPRNDSQQPPGGPAKPMAEHHRHHQLPPLWTAPMHAAQQDNSSAPQKRLYPCPPARPNANTSGNGDTSLSNLVMLSPAHTNKENEKHQRGFPNRLPPLRQCSYNPDTVRLPAIKNDPNGHAHLNWRNTPIYPVTFEEPVQYQGSLQGCNRRIYVDEMCQYSPMASLCSPTASHTTLPHKQKMELHPQDTLCQLMEVLANKQVFSLLPPTLPPIRSSPEANPESSKGNQVAINENNSEGFPMQREKQTESKADKKSHSSKAYINPNMTLGGLGPDYEAVKEKKEKLRQQKEYAKQVQERNMKNMALIPTVKPKVVPLTARQKALEYAKKILKPKTFKATPFNGEERVLPQTLNGKSLPKIPSLEALQIRHEKEKQVIATFRNLDAVL